LSVNTVKVGRACIAQECQRGLMIKLVTPSRLSHIALDPFGKIPEFKYCAARVERAEAQREVAQ
jgi:hypothetical protein